MVIAVASIGMIALARIAGFSGSGATSGERASGSLSAPPWAVTSGASHLGAPARATVAGSLRVQARRLASVALYRALLTTQYSPLPSDFHSAKVGPDEPTKTAKRHHALGSVLVTIDNGAAAVRYTVFPTAADAAASFRAPLAKPEGVVALRLMGQVPGYRSPSRWANGTVAGKTAFGKTVRMGFAAMGLQRGNVMLSAAMISVNNESSGDIDGTIRLLGSALAHLRRVQTRLSL